MNKPHEFYYLVAERVKKEIQNGPFTEKEFDDLVDFAIRVTDEQAEAFLRELYDLNPSGFVELVIDVIRSDIHEKVLLTARDQSK